MSQSDQAGRPAVGDAANARNSAVNVTPDGANERPKVPPTETIRDLSALKQAAAAAQAGKEAAKNGVGTAASVVVGAISQRTKGAEEPSAKLSGAANSPAPEGSDQRRTTPAANSPSANSAPTGPEPVGAGTRPVSPNTGGVFSGRSMSAFSGPSKTEGASKAPAEAWSNGVSNTSTATAAPPAAPAPQPRPTSAAASMAAGPRTVRLTIARVNPWSVLKLSFLLSVALGIAFVVANALLWQVLNGLGLFTSLNQTITEIGGVKDFDLNNYVGLTKVMSLATVIAVFNVVIIMALATLTALLYNLAGSLVGGLQVTLTDD